METQTKSFKNYKNVPVSVVNNTFSCFVCTKKRVCENVNPMILSEVSNVSHELKWALPSVA